MEYLFEFVEQPLNGDIQVHLHPSEAHLHYFRRRLKTNIPECPTPHKIKIDIIDWVMGYIIIKRKNKDCFYLHTLLNKTNKIHFIF